MMPASGASDDGSTRQDNGDHASGDRTRAETVDLADNSLVVSISDAVSEKDKVKFTVHTKTTLPAFSANEFCVTREHDEFVWLHDRFVENEIYSGYILPPPPPHPDFESSRRKLQHLGESEGSMTKEEFNKFKQDLEAEYLALFKKTVAMHETFLCRIAHHEVLRNDHNFHVFLEYDQDLNIRGKNKRELFQSLRRNMTKSADGVILLTQNDVDEQFEQHKRFLNEYFTNVREGGKRSDSVFTEFKHTLNDMVKVCAGLHELASLESGSAELQRFFTHFADLFERMRKIEFRKAADHDLKLSDTLHYFQREVQAAQDLCLRRTRALANMEAASKALEKARARNRDVPFAEQALSESKDRFEKLSTLARSELEEFRTRRVAGFKRNLNELVELQLKHSRTELQMLETMLAEVEQDSTDPAFGTILPASSHAVQQRQLQPTDA